MADWSAIREGLQTRLATITGMNAYDILPMSDPKSPAALVGGPEGREFQINYHVKGGPRGANEWIVPVLVLANSELPNGGQDELDKYLDSSGATSIVAALEGDRTLGGAVSDLTVEKCEDYGRFGKYTGVKFTVRILTSN